MYEKEKNLYVQINKALMWTQQEAPTNWQTIKDPLTEIDISWHLSGLFDNYLWKKTDSHRMEDDP